VVLHGLSAWEEHIEDDKRMKWMNEWEERDCIDGGRSFQGIKVR